MVLRDVTTRGRILLLVVAAALPGILVSVYVALDQRDLSLRRAADEMERRLDLIEALLPATQLDALPRRGAEILGRGQTVTVIDDDGIVLVQQPPLFARPGDRFPNAAVLEGLAAGETSFDVGDPLGEPRLYAARRAAYGNDPVTIIISMPRSIVHEDIDRALAYSIGGVVIAAAALVVIASLGAERMVLAPIRRMLDVTSRVRGGDLTVRTGMRAGREELSQLGAALDEMANQLAEREGALRRALEEQTRLARTDALTGLYNRRFLRDALERQIAAARRTGKPFSLILFDLDHFKRVNDTFGHDAGDMVLAQTARVLAGIVRVSDVAVRHGGEEFAVLMPDTDLNTAVQRAEEIRQAIENHVTIHGDDRIRVTASFGVVQFASGIDVAALWDAVDAAMYAAKAAGRNCVFLSPLDGEPQRAQVTTSKRS